MSINEVKKALVSASNSARLERYMKNRNNLRKYHANRGSKAPNVSMREFATMINLVARVARQKENAARRAASARKKK
jgi:hypothetical protein